MDLPEIRSHLGKFRVGIAGAGGLGSNCAVALARSGVGTLVICDFDIIEERNLSRQYFFADQLGMMKTAALKENIARINPVIRVICHEKKLDSGSICEIFADCHVIVEAFDSSETKELIIETVQIRMPGKPLVVGSGMAGWGRTRDIRFRKIDETLYVCGDESSEPADNLPLMAPRVGMVANMQANTVIEILMEMNEPVSLE